MHDKIRHTMKMNFTKQYMREIHSQYTEEGRDGTQSVLTAILAAQRLTRIAVHFKTKFGYTADRAVGLARIQGEKFPELDFPV